MSKNAVGAFSAMIAVVIPSAARLRIYSSTPPMVPGSRYDVASFNNVTIGFIAQLCAMVTHCS